MTFRYRRYTVLGADGREGDLYRPDIEVRVVGTGKAIALYGLLDSGADMVLLPQALAEILGVRLAGGARGRVRGFASAPAAVQYGPVRLELAGGAETLSWAARVAFLSQWPDGQEVVILGRAGFLDHFDVLFRGATHEVVLRPNASFPKSR